MTLKKEEEERLLDSAVEVIKGLGAGWDDEGLEYEAAWLRMDREWETLLKTYPDKWVAISQDGVVAVGDSINEAFDMVDAQGVSRGVVEVEFLNTNPTPMLL